MINKENVNVLKLLCHDLLGTDYIDKFIFSCNPCLSYIYCISTHLRLGFKT